MSNKFNELKYQLEGLQNAIDGMMEGVTKEDIRYIRAQMRYMREKSERVLLEAELAIENDEN